MFKAHLGDLFGEWGSLKVGRCRKSGGESFGRFSQIWLYSRYEGKK
jgi:hypothetical protein